MSAPITEQILMNEEVWIPIVLFAATALVLWAFFYYRYRSRSDLQATVRQAIEKGHELSPELLARLGEPNDPKTADLRRGIVAVAVGMGFAVFGVVLGEQDAIRPLIAVGTFPFLVGVAYLGLWLFTKRAD
ncbi:MAG: DUF6249 domain-containing protein [Gammaproteobacteria bacterium]|nr:DUF6249 domain-containing protein [Gammaproteobacteria bacterium]